MNPRVLLQVHAVLCCSKSAVAKTLTRSARKDWPITAMTFKVSATKTASQRLAAPTTLELADCNA